ncbi:p115 like vesicle tethering protein [Kalaharituber pfeilii]|nr:p115 like vesicle tethering protein [Kalaharituber pfeilii]
MSLLSGILQGQAPAKQDATTAIQTLCLRLTSSSLVEDRRAAILSLRSFAREYKEIVASGGLRGLIGILAKDSEDVDTAKVVLETLLLLFVKDETNPESSHDIALWLADEFTQKQENMSILIDLLESPDFYTRLYTLQLLAAVLENRPARTQECVFTAPLGISRLAATFEDKRDAIRNEAILLLVHLTDGHPDVQKIVAFENAFERIFNIIEVEGGLDGGIVVQDCLQLLTNLLGFNASNQTLFRETGFVSRLYKLFNVEGDIPQYALEKRNQCLIMVLGVCQTFVARGGQGTPANQQAFFHSGILAQVLNLAFSSACDLNVRAEALRTCGDIIHGNAQLQESFAQLQVTYINPTASLPELQTQQNGENKIYVIEGLLDQALLNSAIQAFNVRIAACTCLENYFFGNLPIRLHFLRRAIDGYTSGEDETANILACLMDLNSESRNDPYKIWVAAVIFLHIIYDNDEAKQMATSVVLGDEDEGEEVVTAIQTIAANLITCLEHNYDPRISLAYLMVLCTWLYEDTVAVDDFLQEGATVQSLVAAITRSANSNILVQGLCTFLLGILYEFSTTESPVSRATLYTILISRLSRDQYVNKLTRLRENPVVRDFEVTPQAHQGHRGLPEVYFNHIFIDFLKDNYNRIFRTIDKDPGQKTHYKLGSDGTPNGISLELVDSLKAQIVDKEESLNKLQSANMNLEKRLAQEQQDFKKFKESSATEIRKYHEQAEAMKKHYEKIGIEADEQFKATVLRLENRVARVQQEGEGQVQKLEAQLALVKKESEEKLKRQKAQGEMDVKRTKDAWEVDVRRVRQEAEVEIKKLDEGYRKEMARIKADGDALVQRITAESKNEFQRTRVEQENELRKVKEHAAVQLRHVQEQADADLRMTKEQKDAVIKMLEDRIGDLETDLEDAAKTHTVEIQNLKKMHEGELAAAAKSSGENAAAQHQALNALREKLDKAQAQAEEKLKAVQAEYETKLKVAEEKIQSAQVEAKIALAEAKSAQDKVKNLEDEVKKQQEEVKKQKNEIKKQKEELMKHRIDAEEKLNTAEEKAKNIQVELDDLLLVLGDIEEKKKGYKKRLKALGETVSDEEVDDEDEDEDDEGDDGEEEDVD